MAVPGSFVNSTRSSYQLTQTSSELLRAGNTAQCRAIPWHTSGPTFHLQDLTKHHKTKPTSEDTTTLPYYLVERHLLYNGVRNDNGVVDSCPCTTEGLSARASKS